MTDPVTHPSDSAEQRAAEILLLEAVSAHVGMPVVPRPLDLGDARVAVDGVSDDLSVLVEAYAHVGSVKPAQQKKLATDAFKLAWVGRRIGASRLILAVADAAVEAHLLRAGAWLTSAIRDAGVEVYRADLPAEARAQVLAAQRRQFR